jgi:GAF domain-containing protein
MNWIVEWFQAAPSEGTEDARLFWQERILSAVLLGAAVLGTAAYLVNLIPTIQRGEWGWAVIYTLAFAWVLSVALIRRLHYNLRSASFLALLFILGLVSALQFGPAGDARIWMIGFTVLAGVFLGLRAGLSSAFISTATLITIGVLMNQKVLIPSNEFLPPDNLNSWISTGIPFFAMGLLIVASVGILINGINYSLQRGQQLTEELEQEQGRLERRSKALERRELQVRTAAEISRAISAELQAERILQQVVNLLQERFNFYFVGAFLLDERSRYAILRAGTGDAGKQMMAEGHRLIVGGNSIIGQAVDQRQACIALDTGAEAVHFDNPLLPRTRSELALPMVSAGQGLGAITVQSDQPEAFDEDDIAVLQGIADSLATALVNARLFEQVQENLEEIQTLHRQYLAEAWSSVAARSEVVSYTFENPLTGETGEIDEETESSEKLNTLQIPLILRDQVIGNIALETEKKVWSPEEQAFIDAVTNQAVQAMENIRLVEESQRDATHDRVVADIVSKAWASTNIDTILQTTVRELGQALDASEALIQLKVKDEASSQ